MQPNPRGEFGPRWLAIYEMDGDAAAQAYAQRNEGHPDGRPAYTQGPSAWQASQNVANDLALPLILRNL